MPLANLPNPHQAKAVAQWATCCPRLSGLWSHRKCWSLPWPCCVDGHPQLPPQQAELAAPTQESQLALVPTGQGCVTGSWPRGGVWWLLRSSVLGDWVALDLFGVLKPGPR